MRSKIARGLVLTWLMLGHGTANASEPPENWSRSDAKSGLVYYRCQSSSCVVGSRVSCKVRSPRLVTSMDGYRRAMEAQAKHAAESGGELRAKNPKQRSIGAWVLYHYDYTLTKPGYAFEHLHGGFLKGPESGFSIVSSSKDLAATKRNFERMVRRLTSLPLDRARGGCTVAPEGSEAI